MRSLYFCFVICLFQIACVSAAQESVENHQRQKAQRALFKRSSVVLKPPGEYAMRETKRGKTYDPKPRLVTIDVKAGKYELRWIGYDGRDKIVEYQRRDALDALVETRVIKSSDKFIYSYLIRNLPSSPSFIGIFIVQTFAVDVRNEKIPSGEDLYIGHMGSHIPRFSEGVWRTFSPLTDDTRIIPGTTREFQIVSEAQPGVVGCYAHAGEPSLKGADEHMPEELEMVTPGYDGLASCITIGPDERLAKFSKEEKAKYLLDNLPKFVEAGWMAGDTPKIYESILTSGNLAGAFEQAKTDLEKEFITSEVFHIIEGLSR